MKYDYNLKNKFFLFIYMDAMGLCTYTEVLVQTLQFRWILKTHFTISLISLTDSNIVTFNIVFSWYKQSE